MTVGHYNTAKTITIGDALKNDFRVACDSIPVERFELVDFEDGNFVVHWTDQMTLEVRGEDNKVESQESLASRGKIGQKVTGAYSCSQYTIGLNDRVAIQVGELTFVLQYVAPARIVKSSLLKTIDV